MASHPRLRQDLSAGQLCYLLEYAPLQKPSSAVLPSHPPPEPIKAPSPPAAVYPKIEQGDDGRPLYFEDLSLAALRDQAHSPLVQYEYVAVDCEGQETENLGYADENGITHIGLAYMPSSVPPPLTVEERAGQAQAAVLHHISSHDWRRLESVDLDDMVATYGIQAASTRLSDRESSVVREQFRYGRQVHEVAAIDLHKHLNQEVERLVSAGNAWCKRATQNQDALQPTEKFQSGPQEPAGSQCTNSPLGAHISAGKKEQKWSPSLAPSQQLTQRSAPTMRLFLASMQCNMELRMLQQHRIQATFFGKNWAGSEGEKQLKRLEERHRSSLGVHPPQPPAPVPVNKLPEPVSAPADSALDRKTKTRLPPPGKIKRRILVVWDVAGERRALDRLAPGLLKQFHGWVDLQQVATPVLRAACGKMRGHSEARMSLRDAMQAVGFKPGFSLQTGRHEKSVPHDPGMDAVRVLGMLARLVAFPAQDLSRMLHEVHVAQSCKFSAHMPPLKLKKSLYPCLVTIFAAKMKKKAQLFPQSLYTRDDLFQLLQQAGLGEPQLLAMAHMNDADTNAMHSPRVCIYYDTLQRLNAAVAALHGAEIRGVVLGAKLCWNPNTAWHCAYSQVPLAPMPRNEKNDDDDGGGGDDSNNNRRKKEEGAEKSEEMTDGCGQGVGEGPKGLGLASRRE
ncbi:hypothetical protein SCUCBS95973_005906 [Sporothrix curviconia]|uniref:Uncharacterized protein n=1 Tax=Sporothrix curviconia TaxID=1260050 RepID=A0ABP0C1R4_9PEZI